MGCEKMYVKLIQTDVYVLEVKDGWGLNVRSLNYGRVSFVQLDT